MRANTLKDRLSYWKNMVYKFPEWDEYFILGTALIRPGVAIKPFEKELKQLEDFESELIKFCKRFDFNIADPVYREMPRPPKSSVIPKNPHKRLLSGRLDSSVAEALLSVFKLNRMQIELANNGLKDRQIQNGTRKKGPLKIPKFYAEHLLVGLNVFKESRGGLAGVRCFIEENGELSKWIDKNIQEKILNRTKPKVILNLFIRKKSKYTDIYKWARVLGETLEGSLTDKKSKKIIQGKGFKDPEVLEIRNRIAKMTREFNDSFLTAIS